MLLVYPTSTHPMLPKIISSSEILNLTHLDIPSVGCSSSLVVLEESRLLSICVTLQFLINQPSNLVAKYSSNFPTNMLELVVCSASRVLQQQKEYPSAQTILLVCSTLLDSPLREESPTSMAVAQLLWMELHRQQLRLLDSKRTPFRFLALPQSSTHQPTLDLVLSSLLVFSPSLSPRRSHSYLDTLLTSQLQQQISTTLPTSLALLSHLR